MPGPGGGGPAGVAADRCSCCGTEGGDLVRLHRQDVAVCFRCLDGLQGQRERRLEGRDGGWLVLSVEPVLFVRDVGRAADHYERLGFAVSRAGPHQATAARDRSLRIRLSLTEWPGRAGHGAVVLVVPDADQVADEWRRAGVEVVGPDDLDGWREGTHTDPDGNLLRFASGNVPG